jgi:hypothetical protein
MRIELVLTKVCSVGRPGPHSFQAALGNDVTLPSFPNSPIRVPEDPSSCGYSKKTRPLAVVVTPVMISCEEYTSISGSLSLPCAVTQAISGKRNMERVNVLDKAAPSADDKFLNIGSLRFRTPVSVRAR